MANILPIRAAQCSQGTDVRFFGGDIQPIGECEMKGISKKIIIYWAKTNKSVYIECGRIECEIVRVFRHCA